MIQTTQNLIEEISILKKQLEHKVAELTKIQEECEHNWDVVVYEPIITEKFNMQTGCNEATIRKTWSRTCTVCGLRDIACHTVKKQVEGMYPGTTAEIEVPYFVEQVGKTREGCVMPIWRHNATVKETS